METIKSINYEFLKFSRFIQYKSKNIHFKQKKNKTKSDMIYNIRKMRIYIHMLSFGVVILLITIPFILFLSTKESTEIGRYIMFYFIIIFGISITFVNELKKL